MPDGSKLLKWKEHSEKYKEGFRYRCHYCSSYFTAPDTLKGFTMCPICKRVFIDKLKDMEIHNDQT